MFRLMTNVVPTTIKKRRVAGLYYCKTTLVNKRQIKRKTAFLLEMFRLFATDTASDDLHLLRSLHHALAQNVFNAMEEVKTWYGGGFILFRSAQA